MEVVSITLMFFLYTHWDSKNVKAGQRIFLALMVIGTFFVYLTVPFWMLHQERVFCHLRYWFLSIGFTLLFGSLTLKTFRIKSIFVSSMALKSAKAYTDNQMLSLLGVLLFIDILICLIWSAASPASVVVIEIDTFRQAHNYYQCSYPPTAIVMLIIMLLYKTFMICFGLYLSVLLWMYGFGNSMFVESRQTIFSMYNVIICVVVGVALEVTLTTSDSRETLFVARSICIFLTGFMTIMAILAPRLTDPEGLEHQGNDLTGQSNGSKSQQSLSTIQSADYEQVTRKYAALVKRYKLKHPDSDVEDDVYVS
uniref:G-protein coupled receptors family 3 profile domain-containing protein n=1 Tax=Arcella intermedia TaxID=1963864 RepID=A0A6B2LAW0_9EUKA